MRTIRTWAAVIGALAVGCGGTFTTGANPAGFGSTGSGQCASQNWWTSGNRQSASMNPGLACRACHLSSEGPRDFFMGTAYSANDVDLCMSADVPSDAVVEILDSAGAVKVTMPINAVGNFSSSSRTAGLALPYTARVRTGGKVIAMGTPQTDGDCNGCHTATGLNGAPGRVLIP